MAKVRHYSNVFAGKELWKMTEDYGESNTDKSSYVPDISTTRSFLGSVTGRNVQGLYDFPDGKDTGFVVATMLRQKGLDPTEIDKIGEIITAHVESLKSKDRQDELDKIKQQTTDEIMDYVTNFVKSQKTSDSVVDAQSE